MAARRLPQAIPFARGGIHRQELGVRHLRLFPAVHHDDDPAYEIGEVAEPVLDDDNGPSLFLEGAEDLRQPSRRLGVEVC